MIYVPDSTYSCYSVLDSDTVRAYESTPVLDSDVNYRDYFINSHYVYSDGVEHISSLPTCISSQNVTTEVYYRNDFSSILLTFVLLAFICFYLPTRLLFKLFRKKGV